jgi:hypothetical protein
LGLLNINTKDKQVASEFVSKENRIEEFGKKNLRISLIYVKFFWN